VPIFPGFAGGVWTRPSRNGPVTNRFISSRSCSLLGQIFVFFHKHRAQPVKTAQFGGPLVAVQHPHEVTLSGAHLHRSRNFFWRIEKNRAKTRRALKSPKSSSPAASTMD
jgi:hypothetical protein